MLVKHYTNYFTLQEVLNSLANDGFVQILTYRSSTQYKLTREGIDTISFFDSKISPAIREDIDKYLKENKYDLKCEVGTTSDYYKSTGGDYIVHCQVKEGNTNLIELNIAVPIEQQADAMCAKWKDESQDIYDFVIHKLM